MSFTKYVAFLLALFCSFTKVFSKELNFSTPLKFNLHGKFCFLCMDSAKLVVMGCSGVGKTSLQNRFIKNEFIEEHRPTIGAGLQTKEISVDSHNVALNIWDTSGREEYRSLFPIYYRSSSGAILVYDVTKPETFESMKEFLDDYIKCCGSGVPILLLGNKSDLPDKAVKFSDAEEFAKNYENMLVYEVSVKTGEGVQQAFEDLVRKIVENKSACNSVCEETRCVDTHIISQLAELLDEDRIKNEIEECEGKIIDEIEGYIQVEKFYKLPIEEILKLIYTRAKLKTWTCFAKSLR